VFEDEVEDEVDVDVDVEENPRAAAVPPAVMATAATRVPTTDTAIPKCQGRNGDLPMTLIRDS